MEIKAKAKYIRISPKKLRLLADLVRGLPVDQALTELEFSGKLTRRPLTKLINSAVSNAQENFKLQKDNLYLKEIKIDDGPILRRWRPRAFGRATMIRKRSSHISLVLDEKVPTVRPAEPRKSPTKQVKLDKDKKEDVVKVEDFDEFKDLAGQDQAVEAREIKQEEQAREIQASAQSRAKGKKGFVKKIFSRRTGDK